MSRLNRLRPLLLWLAVAGVLLRGLVPVGYMPVPVQQGGWLAICHGGVVPQATRSPAGGSGDATSAALGDCPFAGLSAPALPTGAATALALATEAGFIEPAAAPRAATPPARRLPPARAPPLRIA